MTGHHANLLRCAAYCMARNYPMKDLKAFVKEASKDWTIEDDAVVIAQNPAFCLHGVAVVNTPLRKARPWPSEPRVLELVARSDIGRYAVAFEAFVDFFQFQVPTPERPLLGNTAVYQEGPTCLLSGVLNLLLHIPETRISLWNAFNVKQPTREHAQSDLFLMTTPLGRRVLCTVQGLAMKRRGAAVVHVGASGAMVGEVVDAFRHVVPGLADLQEVTVPNHSTVERAMLDVAVRGKSPKRFVELIHRLFQTYPALRGGLVYGSQYRKDGSSVGHVIAFARDADDPTRMRVFNWGTSGLQGHLTTFFTRYTYDFKLYFYELPTVARRLRFD